MTMRTCGALVGTGALVALLLAPGGAAAAPTTQGATPPAVAPAAPAAAYADENLTAVAGGTRASEAVEITTNGRYLDATPDDQAAEHYYKFQRTIPGSEIYFGVTLREGDYAEKRNKITMKLAYIDGDDFRRCGVDNKSPETRPAQMPLATFGGTIQNKRPGCRDAEELILAIWTNGNNGIEPGTPYEFDVWEVPPVENVADLSEVFADGTLDQTVPGLEATATAVPGTTMADAPIIEPDVGLYAELPAGALSWFAVPVAFEEELKARADFGPAESGGAPVEIQLVSPFGGVVSDDPDGVESFPEVGTLTSSPTAISTTGWPSSPVLREKYSVVDSIFAEAPLSAVPGLFYIVVWAGQVGDAETVPVTLSPVTTPPLEGLESPTEPVYDGEITPLAEPLGAAPEAYDGDEAPTPIADPTADPTEEPTDGATEEPTGEPTDEPTDEPGTDSSEDADGDSTAAAAEEDGGLPVLPIGLGVLAALLAAAGVAVLVRTRRA